MADNKNIDKLFQERLKNLETQPREEVWLAVKENIVKKKKRRFPLWWFYSGAAILILSLIIFPSQIKDDPINIPKDTPKVTVTPKEEIEKGSFKKIKDRVKDPLLQKETGSDVIAVTPHQDEKDKTSNSNPKNDVFRNQIAAINPTSFSVQKTNYSIYPNLTIDLLEDTTTAPLKSLIDVVKKNKEEEENTEEQKRWAVQPSFGYANAGSFAETSAIDQGLQNNPVQGEDSYSIGAKVTYKINDRWVLRSGIHSQQLGYTTKDISIISGVVAGSFSSVDSRITSQNKLFIANSSITQEVFPSLNNADLISNNGTIEQIYSYVEIPFEAKYIVSKRDKLAIGFIGGLSALILDRNEINVRANQFSISLGEANNLNSINYSGNLGFDFDYSFSKNWTVNLNPMLKVHLNTFSRNDNGFSPYFLGIYSGLKYSF